MPLPSKESLSLLPDLHLKQEELAQIYSHIGQYSCLRNLLNYVQSPSPKKKIYSLKHVPSYFETILLNPEVWTEKKYASVRGYSFILDDCANVEEYLRFNLSDKRRKNVLRAIRRLEVCFDIRYEILQTNITKEKYHFLMDSLKSMIVRRFDQRGHESNTMESWDKVLLSSYDLLLQNKASLFVIYNQNTPIVVSFNYHYNTNLFNYISSYDISYAKFSLGQIKMYKQLEWCYKNGYDQLDLGWGDMNYKKWWSNNTYIFNHHILYPKYSFAGFLYAHWEGNKSRIMAFLIAKGVNTHVKKIKAMLKLRSRATKPQIKYLFQDIDFLTLGERKDIQLQEVTFPITKEVINDFLFLSHEHQDDVSLYYSSENEQYILKGKKVAKLIRFNTTKH